MTAHTPGPWEWWTSNSWRRLRHSDRGVSTNVILPIVCPDGHPDLEVTADDAALIERAWQIPLLEAEIKQLKSRNQIAYSTQSELIAALRLFDSFSWTAVRSVDCREAVDELNRRIAIARALLEKLGDSRP